MIAVKLKGGLGNQCFQYAAARAWALRDGSAIFLDQSDYVPRSENITPRSFELHHFKLATTGVFCRRPLGYCTQKLSSFAVNMLQYFPGHVVREKNRDFLAPIPRKKPFLLIDGYFQSHHYFQECRSVLLDDFQLKEKRNDVNTSILALINNTNSVSLHVRRGDYLSNPGAAAFHGVLPLEYYLQAISDLESRYAELRYFIFSDDMDWCREMFAFLPDKYFVDCNSAESAYRDLDLMRYCKYHIIANSSFSWWGAWLADYSEGTVLYPRQWFFNEPVNCASRFPAEWRGI